MANRPSLIVVFDPGDFHFCSCLQRLRHGLPCTYYFEVLVDLILIGRTNSRPTIPLTQVFNGACICNRWHHAENGEGSASSVSEVLVSSGHDRRWDGHQKGDYGNYWGGHVLRQDRRCASCWTDTAGIAGPSCVRQATCFGQNECEEQGLYDGEIMRSVPLQDAMAMQSKVGKYVHFLSKS